MLTPFVLCPEEDGGIDSSVFHKMSIAPGFKPAVGRLREALMNNADARGERSEGVIFFLSASERRILT